MWDIIKEFWFFIAIGGFFLFIFLALFLVGAWEKQRVRDFVSMPSESLPAPSRYFQAMNDNAPALGYQFDQIVGQNRTGSSTYRCCLAFWLSADQKSLLSIGGGKLARLDYKRTTLLSRLANNRILVTTDELGTEDLSGTRDLELLMNAHLPELHALHQQRLLNSSAAAIPFSTTNLSGQFEELNQIRVDALVQRGFAKFITPDQNTFRYTLKGAWVNATSGYLRGLKRAEAQKDRSGIKRPGS
jgi:hypothetical protein